MNNDERQLQRMLTDMKMEQFRSIARASGLVDAPPPDSTVDEADSIAPGQLTTFRMRVRALRAAFIGDLRISLLVFLVLMGAFAGGWIMSNIFMNKWIDAERRIMKAKAAQKAYFELTKEFSRVRPTLEENEAFLRFSKELGRLLQQHRAQIDAELKTLQQGDAQDQ